jgi:hypothetical protein
LRLGIVLAVPVLTYPSRVPPQLKLEKAFSR